MAELSSGKHHKVSIEGWDCHGEYAMLVENAPTGEQLVAEAHFNRDAPLACVEVRGFEIDYSMDFVDLNTLEISSAIESALGLAKLAISTVITTEEFRQYDEARKNLQWEITHGN